MACLWLKATSEAMNRYRTALLSHCIFFHQYAKSQRIAVPDYSSCMSNCSHPQIKTAPTLQPPETVSTLYVQRQRPRRQQQQQQQQRRRHLSYPGRHQQSKRRQAALRAGGWHVARAPALEQGNKLVVKRRPPRGAHTRPQVGHLRRQVYPERSSRSSADG